MIRQIHIGVLMVVAGAGLAGLGLAEAVGEIAPYVASSGSTAQRFAAIADGGYAPGDSIWSKDNYFADCLDLPQTMLVRVQPPTRRDAFASHCRAVARAAVEQMPTYSAAWLAIAEASARLDDFGPLNDALLLSARTAPDIAWLADRRSTLALDHMAQLGEAQRAAYQADLATLTRSGAGIDALAARYVRDAGQRDNLTALVEMAPASMQKRFLARVEALTGLRAP